MKTLSSQYKSGAVIMAGHEHEFCISQFYSIFFYRQNIVVSAVNPIDLSIIDKINNNTLLYKYKI